MAGKTGKAERGAVLIIVLFIIAGLAVVSVDMNRNVLLDHAFSLASRSGVASKAILQSGESIVSNFLVRDFQTEKKREGRESLDSMRGRFGIWLENYASKLKKWDLEILIEDENSRFPLRGLFPSFSSDKNRADYYAIIFERMLTFLLIRHGFEGGEDAARLCARGYLESLLAWGGQKMLSNEAAKWYLSREPAYYPPFRAPESLSELLLVYWPDVDEELARKTLLGTEDLPGLMENCSLWSQGPINLNTMKTAVGWGFCPAWQQAAAFMEDFEEARSAQGDWLAPNWHMDVFSAHGVILPPPNTVSDQSRWFRTVIRASQGRGHLASEAVGWIDKTRMTWVSRAIL